MNPSYMASMKATSTLFLNAFLGIEPKPVVKKNKETSINGRAFAPGHGVQQEISSEEKEAKVRAHLDKLASEAKARYLDECSKYPTIEEHSYPRSDMVVLMEEEQERRNTEADAKVMTALYGSDNGAEIDETSTHEQALKALHDTHAAYIERRIALNAKETRERAMNAAVHTGDRRFEAQ